MLYLKMADLKCIYQAFYPYLGAVLFKVVRPDKAFLVGLLCLWFLFYGSGKALWLFPDTAEMRVIKQFYFSNNLLGLRHNTDYFLKCSQWVEIHMG